MMRIGIVGISMMLVALVLSACGPALQTPSAASNVEPTVVSVKPTVATEEVVISTSTTAPEPEPTATAVPTALPEPTLTASAPTEEASMPESDMDHSQETAAVATQLEADFQIDAYQGGDQLGGQTVMFSDVLSQGKPVVLNMWAGLCPTCRAEMPHLQAAYEQYGDQVQFVAVDIGAFVGLGSQEDGRALLAKQSVTFPAGSTPDPDIVRQYKVLGTPATYFFKPDGGIVRQFNGILTGDQLDQQIEELIQASSM